MKIDIYKAIALAPEDARWLADNHPDIYKEIVEGALSVNDYYDMETKRYHYDGCCKDGETLDSYGERYGSRIGGMKIRPEDVFRTVICYINTNNMEIEGWAMREGEVYTWCTES